MNNLEYKVKARLSKIWFCKPEIVYDLMMCYEYWYDPSYGNGGGDYRPCSKRIATFKDESEAENSCKILNRLK